MGQILGKMRVRGSKNSDPQASSGLQLDWDVNPKVPRSVYEEAAEDRDGGLMVHIIGKASL